MGGSKIDIKWDWIADQLHDSSCKPLEWLLERSWRLPEPKTSALDILLGSPREIVRQVLRPDTDRPEVKGRLPEHLWLALAPGERHYQR